MQGLGAGKIDFLVLVSGKRKSFWVFIGLEGCVENSFKFKGIVWQTSPLDYVV